MMRRFDLVEGSLWVVGSKGLVRWLKVLKALLSAVQKLVVQMMGPEID